MQLLGLKKLIERVAMKYFSYTLIAVLLLGGCSAAGRRPVAEPSVGDMARIRVLYAGGGAMTATPNSNCYSPSGEGTGVVVGTAIDVDDGHKNKKIGIPPGIQLPGNWKTAEFYIAAGKPITFAMRTGHSIPFCRFTEAFTPEAEKDYELIAWVNSNERSCGAELHSITDKSKIALKKTSECK
jgi:hypothetical protein